MKRFEYNPQSASVRVYAPTKAGLLVTALRGLFAAVEAPAAEGTADVRREFTLKAADISALLKALLEEAWRQAAANGETYEDANFEFITDTRAEGMFVGRKSAAVGAPIKGVKSVATVEKNSEGEWETNVVFGR